MYVYFLCGLVCICIHESDAELICMWFFVCLFVWGFLLLFFFLFFFVVFFSDVLTYCVMLQDFSCYSYVMYL